MLWRRNNRRDYWRYVGRRVLDSCGPVGEAGVFMVHIVAHCLPWTATSQEARREAKESSARERYWSAITSAIRADDAESIRRLLDVEDRGLGSLDPAWMCEAAYWGCPSVVRLLGAQGMNPNWETQPCGFDCPSELPLPQAVYGAVREGERLGADPALLMRRLETIAALLHLGANVNCHRYWGKRTPLRMAVDYGCPKEVVDLLVSAGGQVRMPMDWRNRSDGRLALTPEQSCKELEQYEGEGGPAMFAQARRRAVESGQAVILYRARRDDNTGQTGQSGGETRGRAYFAVSDSMTTLPWGSVDWWEWWYPDGTGRSHGPPV